MHFAFILSQFHKNSHHNSDSCRSNTFLCPRVTAAAVKLPAGSSPRNRLLLYLSTRVEIKFGALRCKGQRVQKDGDMMML
jgi:hypothetical protein